MPPLLQRACVGAFVACELLGFGSFLLVFVVFSGLLGMCQGVNCAGVVVTASFLMAWPLPLR